MADQDTPEPAPKPEGRRARGGAAGAPVLIKKYANRRLYNTATSTYVTLDHLSDMVKQGVDFVVQDAKTNEDITRPVLTQIIFEQESRGQNLLPIQFLRQLIRFYGDSMQAFVPGYLELSLDSLAKQQAQWAKAMAGQAGAAVPGAPLSFKASPAAAASMDEQMRKNMAMFEQAMKMFTPMAFMTPGAAAAAAPQRPAPPAPEPAAAPPAAPVAAPQEPDAALTELRRQMEQMQAQLAKLSGGGR